MNAEDAIFGTPLVAAARGGHTEVVAALLRKDEVWPDQHSQRDTPLTAAVNWGHLECARLLLDYRNKDIAQKLVATPQQSHDENCAHGHRMPSDDALTLASKRGDVELVKLLLARGADATGGREGTCDTPLTAAAANGHAACLKEILAAGANVDGVARWAGRTALVAAAESDSSGALECCEILLQGGADPNFVSTGVVGRRLGYGAVHAAAARMDSAMVKMLVAHGADPNRRAKNTDTKEVKSRRAAAAQALWGPEVAGQRLDNTPLHLAVAAYINEAAKRRVAESARRRADGVESDDGAGDSDGDAADSSDSNKNQFDTPAERRRRRKLHARAMDQGEPGTGEVAAMEVIKSLLECGADHGAFVVDSTPMHMAALGGALDVVDLLVKHGADVNACAPNGCTTPIEAAARYAADIVVDFAEERDEPPKPALGAAGSKNPSKISKTSPGSDDSAKTTEPKADTRTKTDDAGDLSTDEDEDELRAFRDDAAAMEALRDAAGPLRAVKHLAGAGAEITAAVVVGACRVGDEDCVATVLQARDGHGNPKALVSAQARNTTPLHAAAESGNVAVARMLIELGAQVDTHRSEDDATPLFLAARCGRPGMIAYLHSRGADLEALGRTSDRREGHDTNVTPLVEAVMSDHAAAAAKLIALGADVEAPTSWMPPLLTATLRSNPTVARMLLDEGADPRVGVGGMTPLGLAVMTRQSDLVKALLEWREAPEREGARAATLAGRDDEDEEERLRGRKKKKNEGGGATKSGNTRGPDKVNPDEPIDAAVLDDGDPDGPGACQCPVCQRRSGAGLDPLSSGTCLPSDSKTPWPPYGGERHLTPLAAAAKLDDAETVTSLIKAGADPERMSGGMPPLAHAAGKGSCAAIEALLDGGAILESAASLPLVRGDQRMLTPLGVAAEAGELPAVKLLLQRGADPNGPPGAGIEPPLCCAVTDPPDDDEGNPVVGVVRSLIAAGADPNASKEDAQSPYSPLMVAAGAGSVAVVRELLAGGADLEHVVRVTVGDSGGPRGGPDRKCHITALLHAAYCNELDAVRFLLLQGAKLGSADREAMSLVCDHLRSKAQHGVPDAGATLSLLRHQADDEAYEEEEKAEQRLKEERARAAELKEERKRMRQEAAKDAEVEAVKKAEEAERLKEEEEKAEAERLAARAAKQEAYKKEQEARKAAKKEKEAKAKAAKAASKAAADAQAKAEEDENRRVMEEVQAMVSDLEIKRKAEDEVREARERAEREAAIKEEEERERKEKEAEAAELDRRAKQIAKEAAAVRGKTGKDPKGATKLDLSTAAGAKAHLLARDEAEGFTGPPTKVTKEDATEAAYWANPGGFFVFLCNDSTEEECYERALFGAPAKFWDNTVDNVKPGTTLVLYNFAARTLTGPYEALESPKWNDVPDAWHGGRGAPPGRRLISAFPVQVPIGASPLMEAVTATLGGDFRPSVGGLPLGSPDQSRRDIIVTKLRNAAKEQGVDCPTAADRRQAKRPVAPASQGLAPKGKWAATAATPPAEYEPEHAQYYMPVADGDLNVSAPHAAVPTPHSPGISPGKVIPVPNSPGSPSPTAKAGSKKAEKKKKERERQSTLKTIPAPMVASANGGGGGSPTSSAQQSSVAAPVNPPMAPAAAAPIGGGLGGTLGGLGGGLDPFASAAGTGKSPAAAAVGVGLGGGDYGGAFGGGWGGLGGGSASASAASASASGQSGGDSWNPLFGGSGGLGGGLGGGFGSSGSLSGLGGGVPGLGGGGSVVSGGLFGGSGLFGAPAPNPYAQRGPSPAPGPPGYAPNPYAQHAQHAQQQQQQQQQQNGADEAPQFSQAEQSKLFPWLQ